MTLAYSIGFIWPRAKKHNCCSQYRPLCCLFLLLLRVKAHGRNRLPTYTTYSTCTHGGWRSCITFSFPVSPSRREDSPRPNHALCDTVKHLWEGKKKGTVNLIFSSGSRILPSWEPLKKIMPAAARCSVNPS